MAPAPTPDGSGTAGRGRGRGRGNPAIAATQSNANRNRKFIQTNDKFCIPEKTWQRIGHEMDLTAQKGTVTPCLQLIEFRMRKLTVCIGLIPSSFGANIRSISDHHHQFKCEEWLTWGLRYMEVYLFEELPTHPFYVELIECIDSVLLSLEKQLSLDEVEQIRIGFIRCIEHYEKEYYQYDESRLDAIKPTFHQPAHTADQVEDCGLCYVCASWSTEGVCGILGRGCKSRKDIFTNISNNILRNERLTHLRFTLDFDEFRKASLVETFGGLDQNNAGNPVFEKQSHLTMLRELQATSGDGNAFAEDIRRIEEEQRAVAYRMGAAASAIVEDELRRDAKEGHLMDRQELYSWYYKYLTNKANRGMFLLAEGNDKAKQRVQTFAEKRTTRDNRPRLQEDDDGASSVSSEM